MNSNEQNTRTKEKSVKHLLMKITYTVIVISNLNISTTLKFLILTHWTRNNLL